MLISYQRKFFILYLTLLYLNNHLFVIRYPNYNKYLYSPQQMTGLYISDNEEKGTIPRLKYTPSCGQIASTIPKTVYQRPSQRPQPQRGQHLNANTTALLHANLQQPTYYQNSRIVASYSSMVSVVSYIWEQRN